MLPSRARLRRWPVSPDQERWQRLIDGLRRGDRYVAQDFWDQYGKMLHAVADKHLGGAVRRRVGPEDIVQSACRTFLRRAQVGEFQLPDSEALWRLLCAITLTKVREQTRFHLRKKRGLDQEIQVGASDESGAPAFQPVAEGPTPAEAAVIADQCHQLLACLAAAERLIVDLKLQQTTHDNVAAQ